MPARDTSRRTSRRSRPPGSIELEISFGDERARSPGFRVADDATFATTAGAVLDYFKANRHTGGADRRIRIYQTDRYVDVWGGWKDAAATAANTCRTCRTRTTSTRSNRRSRSGHWRSRYEAAPALYRKAGLEGRLIDEVFWGADHLRRLLDPAGYFYVTVFDRWASPAPNAWSPATRASTASIPNYQAAYREGAALPSPRSPARRARQRAGHGEFSGRPTFRPPKPHSPISRRTIASIATTGSKTSSTTTPRSWPRQSCIARPARTPISRRHGAGPGISAAG